MPATTVPNSNATFPSVPTLSNSPTIPQPPNSPTLPVVFSIPFQIQCSQLGNVQIFHFHSHTSYTCHHYTSTTLLQSLWWPNIPLCSIILCQPTTSSYSYPYFLLPITWILSFTFIFHWRTDSTSLSSSYFSLNIKYPSHHPISPFILNCMP